MGIVTRVPRLGQRDLGSAIWTSRLGQRDQVIAIWPSQLGQCGQGIATCASHPVHRNLSSAIWAGWLGNCGLISQVKQCDSSIATWASRIGLHDARTNQTKHLQVNLSGVIGKMYFTRVFFHPSPSNRNMRKEQFGWIRSVCGACSRIMLPSVSDLIKQITRNPVCVGHAGRPGNTTHGIGSFAGKNRHMAFQSWTRSWIEESSYMED